MFQLYSLEGNRQKLDGGAMFGNAPRALWERWLKPDEKGRIELACRALLLVSEERKILCEAGIGAFFPPKLAERYGVESPERHLLLESLESHGFSQEEIDYVVLSHLHFDHVGGLLPAFKEREKGNNELLFPKAKYLVSKKALERAKAPHKRDRASFIPEIIEKLEISRRLEVIESPEESKILGPSFSFFQSHGHSPGQMHLVLTQNKRKIFFCGDLIPGVPWLNPSISMGYDRFPELLLDEKGPLLKEAEEHNSLLFFTHDPNFCASGVETFEKKIKPKNPLTSLKAYTL